MTGAREKDCSVGEERTTTSHLADVVLSKPARIGGRTSLTRRVSPRRAASAAFLALLLFISLRADAEKNPPAPTRTVNTQLVNARGERLKVLEENGPPENRIKLLITADCYTAKMKEGGLFKRHAESVARDLFSCEPFKTYRGFFNIYSLYTASDNARPARPNVAGRGGSRYGSVQRARKVLTADYGEIRRTAREFLDPDLIIVIVNNGSGVAALSNQDLILIGTQNGLPLTAYFVGLSFGGLAPEWSDRQNSVCNDEDDEERLSAFISEPPYPNVTIETDPAKCKWRHWFPEGAKIRINSSPGVGLWEGAYFRRSGIYRPALSCRMRNLRAGFCPVCAEVLVLKFHERVRLIEDVTPSPDEEGSSLVVGSADVDFAVRTPWRRGMRFTSRWFIDGRENPSWRDADHVTISADASLVGEHRLRVEIYDQTGFVRKDPGSLSRDSCTWRIDVRQPENP